MTKQDLPISTCMNFTAALILTVSYFLVKEDEAQCYTHIQRYFKYSKLPRWMKKLPVQQTKIVVEGIKKEVIFKGE